MTPFYVRKIYTGRFKSIMNIFLFVMLILFLIFILVRAEKVNASICNPENCQGCMIGSDCHSTNYCLWDIGAIPMCYPDPDIILDGFEPPDYSIGMLDGQNTWLVNPGLPGENPDSQVVSGGYWGVQSMTIKPDVWPSWNHTSRFYPQVNNMGFYSFFFSINDFLDSGSIGFYFGGHNEYIVICQMAKGLEGDEIGNKLFCMTGGDIWHYVGTVDLYFWNYFTIEFDPFDDKVRWRWQYYNFSGWYDSLSDFNYAEFILFNHSAKNSVGEFISVDIDEIMFGGLGCKSYNCPACRTENDCLRVGCYFNTLTGDCTDYEPGVCGSGTNLPYCLTQVDCESYGGTWLDIAQMCFWGGETPEAIIPFIDYWNLHSDKPPTAFIQGLANFTTPIIEAVSGFLVSFKSVFDVGLANEKGALFGSAVPMALGYATIINDFLGGLPIGEGLIIFISVILLVSVFRIVIKLINIIKP